MKKIVAVLSCFAFSFVILQAQSEIRFGFQLSPTFSWMTTNTNKINSSGTNIGLKLGMLGEMWFEENFKSF